MKINAKKTKIMCNSRQLKHKVRISIDDKQVEHVDQFKYLGSVISADGTVGQRYDVGLHRVGWWEFLTSLFSTNTAISETKLQWVKEAFMKKKKLFTRNMSIQFKKRVAKSVF